IPFLGDDLASLGLARRRQFEDPSAFTELRNAERNIPLERIEQHQYVVPDAFFGLEIGTAEIKAERRALVPLFRLLETAAGVEPLDVHAVTPVFPAKQRLLAPELDEVAGKVTKLLATLRQVFPVYPGDIAV